MIKEGLKIVILQFLEILGFRWNFDFQGYKTTLTWNSVVKANALTASAIRI